MPEALPGNCPRSFSCAGVHLDQLSRVSEIYLESREGVPRRQQPHAGRENQYVIAELDYTKTPKSDSTCISSLTIQPMILQITSPRIFLRIHSPKLSCTGRCVTWHCSKAPSTSLSQPCCIPRTHELDSIISTSPWRPGNS